MENLIKELPVKFPPKHKADKEIPGKENTEEDLKKLARSEIKKLLQQLILLYHPDHVSEDEHGKKYKVLCEEVTKILTAKYECFKG